MSRRRTCCCGGSTAHCYDFRDRFTTDRLAEYTIHEGDWTVAGGVLTTTDADAVITVDSFSPGVARVDVGIPSGADEVRVYCGYADANNHDYISITVDADDFLCLEGVYVRTGPILAYDFKYRVPNASGLETVRISLCAIADPAPASTTGQFVLNIRAGGTEYEGQFHSPAWPVLDVVNGVFGVGTGPVFSGTAIFDNISISEQGDAGTNDKFELDAPSECPHCDHDDDCKVFVQGTRPASITADTSITSNGSCPSCAGYEPTVLVLPHTGGAFGTGGQFGMSECVWDISGEDCIVSVAVFFTWVADGVDAFTLRMTCQLAGVVSDTYDFPENQQIDGTEPFSHTFTFPSYTCGAVSIEVEW